MLKVLFVTSSVSSDGRENVGDRVILAGARNLVAAAFGYFVYKEHGRWGQFEGDPDDFDLIVYAGMPQYGARSKPSREEEYFDELINRSKRAVFMNIGGGTIHPLGINEHYESRVMAGSASAAYYRKQAKRVVYRSVRDLTSKLFFDRIGVPAELRCCPAYYSTQTIQPGKSRPGAIAGLNNKTFVTNRFRGDIGELMAILKDRHPDFDVVSHSGSDLGLISDLGLPHIFFRSEMALLSYYTTVKSLAALRVHGAIPAWTMGAKVVVGGFDNRVGMFDDVGMPVPWVNMITEPQNSIVEQFDALLKDDFCHAPLEKRRELVDFQIRRAAREMREAAPDLIEKASATPVTHDELASHPPAGSVHAATDGYKLTPVLLDLPVGDEESGSEIVEVPAGARASAASKTIELPLDVPGRKYSTRFGKVTGTRISASLKGKSGDLAHNHTVFLPRGEYACLGRIVFKPGDQPGNQGKIELEVRQGDRTLGKRVLDVAALAEKGKQPASASVAFENLYGAMPIEFVMRVYEFTGTEELTFVGASFRPV